jgi:sRNA-binding carbon storage regulator CsrA
MSMFHQLKNIFRSSTKLSSNPEEHKVHRKEAVERIVKEESIAKSTLPIYQGLEQYTLLKRLGE